MKNGAFYWGIVLFFGSFLAPLCSWGQGSCGVTLTSLSITKKPCTSEFEDGEIEITFSSTNTSVGLFIVSIECGDSSCNLAGSVNNNPGNSMSVKIENVKVATYSKITFYLTNNNTTICQDVLNLDPNSMFPPLNVSPQIIPQITSTNATCTSMGTASFQNNGDGTIQSVVWQDLQNSTNQFPGIAVDLPVGNYQVMVSTPDGCTNVSVDTITISGPAAVPGFSVTSTNVTCNGLTTGSATAGPAGFNYKWSTGATTQAITGLGPGTYSVTVSNAGNTQCSSGSVMITEPAPLSLANSTADDITCFGLEDGKITIKVNGGNSGSRTFKWENGEEVETSNQTLIREGLEEGGYSITVTDSKECTTTASFTISEPPQLVIADTAFFNVPCNRTTGGKAEITAGGGTPPYRYDLTPGPDGGPIDGKFTAQNLSEGSYSFVIKDGRNCTTNPVSFTIQKDEPPSIINYDEVLSIDNNTLARPLLETDQENVEFEWQLLGTANIDPSLSILAQGRTDGGEFSQLFVLENSRLPGFARYSFTPVLGDDCEGEAVETLIKVIPGGAILFVPEVFSPNGDGVNDFWDIVFATEQEAALHKVAIYNRSGGLVYDSEDMVTPWDGTGCPDGPYFYLITNTVTGQTVKGAVTLIRDRQ